MQRIQYIILKYFLFAVLLFCQASCANSQEKTKSGATLYAQHAFLLEKSVKFDEANKTFRHKIQAYIDTCREYNSYLEKRISPFENKAPIQLKPYLLNNEESEIIVMVLTREKDLRDKPVDYVHFFFGKMKNGLWKFRLKEGYVQSFSYENEHPQLSDTEISLRILATLVNAGYMKKNTLKIENSFFKNDTW